jgi:type III secretion system needle length determinant
MSISGVSGPGRPDPSPGPAGRPKENRESAARLERALRDTEGRDNGKDPGQDRDHQEKERRPETAAVQAGPFSGAAILRGLLGPEAEPAEALSGPDDSEGRLKALSEIADRLLVSESGNKEIRIQLKESLLPGTELRLTLQDGSVGVSFVCHNEQSALFLERHRRDLERRLADRLGGPAEVRVSQETAEDHDGRSRGRRDLYAEGSGD